MRNECMVLAEGGLVFRRLGDFPEAFFPYVSTTGSFAQVEDSEHTCRKGTMIARSAVWKM